MTAYYDLGCSGTATATGTCINTDAGTDTDNGTGTGISKVMDVYLTAWL